MNSLRSLLKRAEEYAARQPPAPLSKGKLARARAREEALAREHRREVQRENVAELRSRALSSLRKASGYCRRSGLETLALQIDDLRVRLEARGGEA